MTDRKHAHYYKDVSALTTIDIYRVLKLWDVTDPCLQHAVKKLLVAGGRGAGKDISQDVQEAIDTLTRWQEMQGEGQSKQPRDPWAWCRSTFRLDSQGYVCTLPPGHAGRHECWEDNGTCAANWPNWPPTS